MSWKSAIFKIGQIIGIGATTFISFWLITHPIYEPNPLIRWGEIIGSAIAALVLALDFLDVAPVAD